MAARGQQSMPVIGVLDSYGDTAVLPAFRDGLSESGYTVGGNVVLDVRSTDQYDRLPVLAADLVSDHPKVLVAVDGPSARVAKATTATIPIVFSVGGDPVALGLVSDIAHPSGNITGVTFFSAQLLQKQVGLMHELFPKARTFGVLADPQNPRAVTDLVSVRVAADSIGIEIHVVNAVAKTDFEEAFTELQSRHIDTLLVLGDPLTARERGRIAELALRYELAAMMFMRRFAESGGLISYGASDLEAERQAGRYAGRILRGERPGELPVLQPTKFDLVINLKTAKALGLTIPPGVLAIADEVIE